MEDCNGTEEGPDIECGSSSEYLAMWETMTE